MPAEDSRPEGLCLMGPTAAGKTELALALAEELDAEILSVDSALVYRGMDIGTAKPSRAERARIPHHLIDIRDPAEPYSAADFRQDAIAAMRAILDRGRKPLLVGGTMLYFRVLQVGLADLPPADPGVRAAIAALAEREGWAAVHRELAVVDPESAARIRPTDPQRLQRALEVYRLSGRALSAWHREQAPPEALPCRLRAIAIAPAERAELHRRIAMRFRAMLAAGFLEEVRALHVRGDLDPSLPSIRSVGYRQAWEHIEGRIGYDEMQERAIMATRQMAKRQLTWLRSWEGLDWILTDPRGRVLAPDAPPPLLACLKRLRSAPIT